MKQLWIIAILWCLGWNAQAEGTLRLLNTKFDHRQFRAWVENPTIKGFTLNVDSNNLGSP